MSGQGGAFCTDDYELYKKAKLYSHHGIDKELTGKYYWSNIVGYNYNWTNIQAALALAQLRRINDLIDYKDWLFKEYKKHLDSIVGLEISPSYENVEQVYWICVVVIDEKYGIDKEQMIKMFLPYKIDIRPIFYPLSSMPAFEDKLIKNDMPSINPISYKLSKYAVCLPNGNNLKSGDVERICNVFKTVLNVQE